MRLIDADALHADFINDLLCIKFGSALQGTPRSDIDVSNVLERIEEAPTIDAVPVRRGEWLYNDMYLPNCAECSECGWKSSVSGAEISSYHYCPNCGARMDGGD